MFARFCHLHFLRMAVSLLLPSGWLSAHESRKSLPCLGLASETSVWPFHYTAIALMDGTLSPGTYRVATLFQSEVCPCFSFLTNCRKTFGVFSVASFTLPFLFSLVFLSPWLVFFVSESSEHSRAKSHRLYWVAMRMRFSCPGANHSSSRFHPRFDYVLLVVWPLKL